jgi:hypothetical protein
MALLFLGRTPRFTSEFVNSLSDKSMAIVREEMGAFTGATKYRTDPSRTRVRTRDSRMDVQILCRHRFRSYISMRLELQRVVEIQH